MSLRVLVDRVKKKIFNKQLVMVNDRIRDANVYDHHAYDWIVLRKMEVWVVSRGINTATVTYTGVADGHTIAHVYNMLDGSPCHKDVEI